MSEPKNAQPIQEIVDLSVLRPRHPRLIKASGALGALAGVVYGVLAHRAETAIIPVDLLLFGALGVVMAWLLDISTANNSPR